jgi:hypothetical protein
MKKSDLIEILTEIENLILTNTRSIKDQDGITNSIIDPDNLRLAISQRIKELNYDEWAG